ncbi:50S ribosomal protein L4 [Verrucomicrobia bacterium SCGC AG-212-E04]|nr:50S ribosomal protein L4 [Verrucomicrobia bacterium SCGC AG-212-E04]
MSATILTVDAAKAAKLDLITDKRKGMQALHETIVAYRANRRAGTASTKTKATVSGSGKKPYRQKGTGRARAGYMSSPIRRGGGVVFGPHPRDYSKKTNKSVKRLALRKALSAQIIDGNVLIVSDFNVKQAKTKDFVAAVAKITDAVKVLIVSGDFTPTTYLAARNVGPVQLMTDAECNAEHLLKYEKIVVTKKALDTLVQRTVKADRRETTSTAAA